MSNEESESEVEIEENPISTQRRNDDVFPPINHENLPIQKPNPILIFPPETPPAKHRTRDVALRWARLARSRLLLFLRCFKDSKWLNTNNNRWFGCGVGVTATVLVWWFYARRRRRSKGRMVLAIREKDEKIKQLLHQIAQMNQLLLSLHKSSLSQGGGVT